MCSNIYHLFMMQHSKLFLPALFFFTQIYTTLSSSVGSYWAIEQKNFLFSSTYNTIPFIRGHHCGIVDKAAA